MLHQPNQPWIVPRPRHVLFVVLAVVGSAALPDEVFAEPYLEFDMVDTPWETTRQINVLDNDSDDGINPLNVSTVEVVEGEGPYNGSAIVDTADGSIWYVPFNGFEGWDWFSYSVMDTAENSSSMSVLVYVVPPDAQPARDDVAYAHVDETIAIDVLANDGNLGTPLDTWSHTIVNEPEGMVWAEEDGIFYYTPPPGFSGDDSFSYYVCDVNGVVSNFATVTVHMVDNKPPVIVEYDAVQVSDYQWVIVGRIIDENPQGLVVTFGGTVAEFQGETATAVSDGAFSLEKTITDGSGGWVTVETVDETGLESPQIETYIDP